MSIRTIAVSSDSRGMGKTLVIQHLTGVFTGKGLTVSCMKLSRGGHGPDSVTRDPGPEGSDTRRYHDSGAVNSIFFKYSSMREMEEFIAEIGVETDILVLESNSAVPAVDPDFHVHICSEKEVKPSAEGLEQSADIAVDGPLSDESAARIACLSTGLMGISGKPPVTVGGKFWLNLQGNPLFGEGRMELLGAIRETGSILQAAKQTGIEYKRAWTLLHDAEERLGAKLLISDRGGTGGGGTMLNPLAVRLLEIWERTQREFVRMISRLEV